MHDHHHGPPADSPGPAVPKPPDGIVGLVRHGFVDAELAATIWLLVEGGCPLVVADPGSPVRRGRLLDAFLEALPATVRRVPVTALEPGDERGVYAVAGDLGAAPRDLALGASTSSGPPRSALLPADRPWDFALGRAVAGALSVLDRGVGLGVAIEAASLEEAFAFFRSPAIRVVDDRLSYLGLVIVVGDPEAGEAGDPARSVTDGERRAAARGGAPTPRTPTARTPTPRVVAAHYVRPLSRDAGGHLQRPGPAVLVTWDEAADRFEHFDWGVVPELAARIGRTAGEFEVEAARRTAAIAALAAG